MEVLENLRLVELRNQPDASYMEKQKEITGAMRAILVDWMVEVHTAFEMVGETLYLAVNLVDRYLEHVQVKRTQLQLVGVTSVLVACKYEETHPPTLRQVVHITDHAYTTQEVREMERDILHTLGFHLSIPSAREFAAHFLEHHPLEEATPVLRHMTHYIAELSLQELPFLKFTPSLLAAASILVARRTLKVDPPWPPHLETCTQYALFTLDHCARELEALLATCGRARLQAVRTKYSKPAFASVAADHA